MKNIGPEMTYSGSGLLVQGDVNNQNRPPGLFLIDAAPFELPSSFEMGIGYRPQLDEINSLQLSGTFQNSNFSSDEVKLGAEYGYNDMLFFRGGYQLAPSIDSEDFLYGFTAGFGINYQLEGGIGFVIDYAFRDVQYLESNHVFSLGLEF